jgi:hypothetical protein
VAGLHDRANTFFAKTVGWLCSAYIRRNGIAIADADDLMKIPDASPQRDPLVAHINVLAKVSTSPAQSR